MIFWAKLGRLFSAHNKSLHKTSIAKRNTQMSTFWAEILSDWIFFHIIYNRVGINWLKNFFDFLKHSNLPCWLVFQQDIKIHGHFMALTFLKDLLFVLVLLYPMIPSKVNICKCFNFPDMSTKKGQKVSKRQFLKMTKV